MIKVKMVPHLEDVGSSVSGIMSVIKAYFKHLPDYGVELVGRNADSFDVLAVHAGMSDKFPAGMPLVCHSHGWYWSADFPVATWELKGNRNVTEAARHANLITVPSSWVAETVRRDLRVNPYIVPHGIDWQEWEHQEECEGYVLGYAKNRAYLDVCDPTYLTALAKRFPHLQFLATFAPPDAPANVKVIGLQPPEKMKQVIQRAACVISPLKETFGVLTLEAMASGVPVLGYAYGGNLDLVRHRETGYLAKVNDQAELESGLSYCLEHWQTLGDNARLRVKDFSWENACQLLTTIYDRAMQPENPTVAVVIPSYNYAKKVGDAIRSVQSQTYTHITSIVVVDDGSKDDGATERVVAEFRGADARIEYLRQDNAGVAVARNRGIAGAPAKYIVPLDADDQIDPLFVEACVEALEKDRSLGIAYTGLLSCHANGYEEPSPWPHRFDADAQFRRANQIPTCCLFRREAWQRVGGYRQRYAPHGCGSEDADFWTRILAYGYGAVQATEAPLFRYSAGTGYVSGNKSYHEVDWLALHPWSQDGMFPFGACATPQKFSHPVRQYDEPTVSVIIPVGPGHKRQVFNALDSLEAQTLRKWEAIVVDDTGDPEEKWEFDGVPDGLSAYPYVKLITTPGRKGAGYARNRGAEAARGALITFLDADDNFFSPAALEAMVDAYTKSQAVIYSDYIGKAYVDQKERDRLRSKAVLMDDSLFAKEGLVMYRGHASDYDCERAIRQPAPPEYIWNLITSVLPKAWHVEIGGFDEQMPSWEDWDYWIRLAKKGYCFVRIEEPLVMYRFYTGTRREVGIQDHQNLIQYLLNKYERETKPMACGCSKNKKTMSVAMGPAAAQAAPRGINMSDDDFHLVTLEDPNRGQHHVWGQAVFTTQLTPQMKPVRGGFSFYYGYRGAGERLYVHKDDIALQPHIFVPVPIPAPVVVKPEPQPEPEPQPVAPPPFDLQTVPGVTKAIAMVLEGRGVNSLDCIVEMGSAELAKLEGISERRAATIYNGAKKLADKTK